MNKQSKVRTKVTRKQTSARRVSQTSAPRTAEELFARPAKFQEQWELSTQVVSVMRADRLSLTKAAREFGVDPRAVIRLVGSALRKRKNGRYIAKPSDTLLRILLIPTGGGLREIALRESRQASVVGEFWNAVHRYLAMGDTSLLRNFEGKDVVDAEGGRVPLLTDMEMLDRLGGAGELSFESIYARTT